MKLKSSNLKQKKSGLNELSWLERLEIARQIKEGYSSGIMDNEENTRVSWELKYEKFKS